MQHFKSKIASATFVFCVAEYLFCKMMTKRGNSLFQLVFINDSRSVLFVLSSFFYWPWIIFFCNYVLVLTTKFTAISEIKCGKTDLYLKARVIHLWRVPDKLNPAEDGSLQMVLLDEKVCIYSINWSYSFMCLFHLGVEKYLCMEWSFAA